MTRACPPSRIRRANERPERAGGEHVLYWMIAARRPRWNFGLQRAAERARALGVPLLVLEALRCDHSWASARLHRFVLQGMAANARAFAKKGVAYHPYVEPRKGAGKGLLEALALRAALVVTDEFPCFFLPRMVAAAARRLDVRLEVVDSIGLLPLSASEHAFPTAHSFRRFLQRELPPHLEELPARDPLGRGAWPRLELPSDVRARWPAASRALLEEGTGLETLPIDAEVAPVEGVRGGHEAATRLVRDFLGRGLETYAEHRNDPEEEATSGFSPYLHFGHLAAHEVFAAVVEAEEWSPEELGADTSGKREGWWGTSPSAEAFLDQLVTWRELGHHFCLHRPDHDRYESLPAWARATLDEHATDPREHLYELEDFEAARTHDELWNAAQRQLVREGRIHNYLRMVWGKKVLEWTRSPREALAVLFELNDRWALDGRDPNSTSGITWCLGRFDRAWGPERPVFGKIRYMTTANTRRKTRVGGYLERYGPRGLFADA